MANDKKTGLSDPGGAPVGPQGVVDVKNLKTDTKTTESGDEVKTAIPHGDFADVRADDPPIVAAQKVLDAQAKADEASDLDPDQAAEDRRKASLAALDPGQNSDVDLTK